MSELNAPLPSPGTRRIDLALRFRRFQMPPVSNALVVGRKAAIGPVAIHKAMEEMTPGRFELVPVRHDVAEAVIVLVSDLRKIPRAQLIETILRHAGPIMDEADTVEVQLEIEIHAAERIEIA